MLSNLDLIKCNHNFYHYQNIGLRYLYQTITGLFFGHVMQNSSDNLTDKFQEINESWNSRLCRISFLSKFDEPVNFIILSDFSEFIIDIETSIFSSGKENVCGWTEIFGVSKIDWKKFWKRWSQFEILKLVLIPIPDYKKKTTNRFYVDAGGQ